MENASKALIIVASVLITVMIFTFMMYMFNKFGAFATETEGRLSEKAIQKFNSQFLPYETVESSSYIITTTAGSTRSSNPVIFRNFLNISTREPATLDQKSITKQELILVSQNLNIISDVVTAVNSAIDTNRKNNNNYQYSALEKTNTVEVIVDFGTTGVTLNGNEYKGTYSIEPNASVAPNHIYKNTVSNDKNANINSFSTANSIDLYNALADFRNSTTINFENKTYTIHKYYFSGSINLSEITKKVDSIRFTLMEDKSFEKIKDWNN